jgi:hypothetical protein
MLISGEDAFDDLAGRTGSLASNPGDTLMHRIRYG